MSKTRITSRNGLLNRFSTRRNHPYGAAIILIAHLASHSPLNPRVNNAVGLNPLLVVDVSKSRVGKSRMCDQM